jgi:hypothetical protein
MNYHPDNKIHIEKFDFSSKLHYLIQTYSSNLIYGKIHDKIPQYITTTK